MKRSFYVGLTGLLFGFVLARVGFSSWDEVHRMFTFTSLRLTLAFAVAVGTLAAFWALLKRVTTPRWTPRPIHKGTIVGGLLFGCGWALSGACPSIVFVQLGEGQGGALFTLFGIVAGNWLYAVVHQRYFRFTTGSCLDE